MRIPRTLGHRRGRHNCCAELKRSVVVIISLALCRVPAARALLDRLKRGSERRPVSGRARHHLAAAAARATATAIRAQAPQSEPVVQPDQQLRGCCVADRQLGRHLGRQRDPILGGGVLHFAQLPKPFRCRGTAMPGFFTLPFVRPIRGRRSADRRHLFWSRCEARRAPSDRCARPPALRHWRFFGCGSALPSPALPPVIVQRAPRGRVVVPGGRVPHLPSLRLRAAAAGRQTSLHLRDRLRKTALIERGLTGIEHLHIVVNIKVLNVVIVLEVPDATLDFDNIRPYI